MATLAENLQTLNETKQAIKTAIEGKGQDLTGVPFTEYAEKIAEIKVGGVIQPLVVTESGEYIPPEGIDGYAPVTVNVDTQKFYEQGIEIGYNNGYEVGEKEGYDKGYQVGYGVNADFLNTVLNRDLDNEVYLEIPNGIKYLGQYVFSNWYNKHTKGGLVGVNLNEVETVKNGIFSGDLKLTSVNAPNLKIITYDMFYNTALEEVYFPNVETMNDGNAFRNCLNLKKAVFDKLEEISNSDFNACKVLKALIIRTPKVCVLNAKMSTNCVSFYDGTTTIYVPDDLVEQYKVATNWVQLSEIIKPLSEYVEV